jgi:hypothetical protein
MRLPGGIIDAIEILIVIVLPISITLLALLLIKFVRSDRAGRVFLRLLGRVHVVRWWLRAVACVFVLLWILAGYYDIGWRTSNGDYLMLTRGLFYVIFRGGVFGLGPWWDRDMVWTFREHAFGPSHWLGFDVATDHQGFGMPLCYLGFLLTVLSFAPAVLKDVARVRRFPQGRCQACGYPTRGLTTAKCPECGEVVEHE